MAVLGRRGEGLRAELEAALQTQKDREKEVVRHYEVALQQLRTIKDNTQAECLSLRQKLKDRRGDEPDAAAGDTGRRVSPIATLTTWERDQYELIIRRQQRAIWSLRRERIFSALSPNFELARGAHSTSTKTQTPSAVANKLATPNRLAREAREAVNAITQSVHFTSSPLAQSGFDPTGALGMPGRDILDFSTAQARNRSARIMFGNYT
ncbi:unnamed protein product [Phytomonas sp. Hart1]|nr:unnamed protein product [Phytomonas sp. Hart1]|eukprot:CCW71906.1 unnamed protein product [Phytomonas sp. isolate Hart1]